MSGGDRWRQARRSSPSWTPAAYTATTAAEGPSLPAALTTPEGLPMISAAIYTDSRAVVRIATVGVTTAPVIVTTAAAVVTLAPAGMTLPGARMRIARAVMRIARAVVRMPGGVVRIAAAARAIAPSGQTAARAPERAAFAAWRIAPAALTPACAGALSAAVAEGGNLAIGQPDRRARPAAKLPAAGRRRGSTRCWLGRTGTVSPQPRAPATRGQGTVISTHSLKLMCYYGYGLKAIPHGRRSASVA